MDPEKTAGGTGDALAKTDTGTVGAAAAAATTPPPAATTTTTTTTKASDAEPSDDEDWIANHAGMTDNQKKFVKAKITQNVNLRDKVRKLESEKNDRETAEAEAKRLKDIEDGNYKKIADESETKLQAIKTKLLRAELRAHAQKAGIKDLNDVDLMPLDELKTNKEGEATNADAVINKWKEARPHWFEEPAKTDPAGTTSSKITPPPGTSPVTKDALKMTPQEYADFKTQSLASEKK